MLAVGALAVGAASHAYLRYSEARQVSLLNQPGHRAFLDDLEMTRLKEYRDHLRELNQQWLKERGDAVDHPLAVHADL